VWGDPIVTEISPAAEFYPAEDYHQDYFNKEGDSTSYCRLVIRPKVEKFKKVNRPYSLLCPKMEMLTELLTLFPLVVPAKAAH